MTLALLLSALSAWYMTGVIWTIQRVHYALFDTVCETNWQTYHAKHTQRMTPLVLLPMTVELGSSAWLAAHSGQFRGSHAPVILGFALSAATWAATAFIAVPLHSQLSKSHNLAAIHKLVQTNWLRTCLWTGHSLTTFYLLWERLPPTPLLRH